MEVLFASIKQFLPIIIITIVLGYFLGLSVSTVVDYRLKDAVLNLPQPKNNIIVRLDDKTIAKETFVGSQSKTKPKTTPKSKSKTKSVPKEGFINYSKVDSKETFADTNVDSYALAYDISKKSSEKSNKDFPYVPFNYEDDNLNYSSIEDISKLSSEIRPAKNIKSIRDYKNSVTKDHIEDLPAREKRDKHFLKQRAWEDTTYTPIDN